MTTEHDNDLFSSFRIFKIQIDASLDCDNYSILLNLNYKSIDLFYAKTAILGDGHEWFDDIKVRNITGLRFRPTRCVFILCA
jgi:hypothetical protein